MRSVVIVHDGGNQRAWVAVDRQTTVELLRLQDRDQLERICWRLGWDIVAQRVEGRATTVADLRRAIRSAKRA